jgi:hypothetical protein
MHMDRVFVGSATPLTLSQTLSGLSTSSQTYNLAFYSRKYRQASNVCTLSVSVGGMPIVTQVFQKDPGASALGYLLVTGNAIPPTLKVVDLVFTYSCDSSDDEGDNVIFIDDVSFVPVC